MGLGGISDILWGHCKSMLASMKISSTEIYLVRHNEEDAKHKYTVLEKADMEMLLLENLLEKSESNCEWKPQVNKLCFNIFDEEMKYLKGCIGKYESVKYLVSLDG